MNNSSEKPPAPSQIGREVFQGKQTDRRFLEKQMGFTPEEEAQRLAKIAEEEATLALEQIERFCESDPSLTATAFKQLIKLYPEDSRVSEWKERVEKAK